MPDIFPDDRSREEQLLREAGWKQAWSDYWCSPDGNVTMQRADALRLIGAKPADDAGHYREKR
jgi:hypothetical protein